MIVTSFKVMLVNYRVAQHDDFILLSLSFHIKLTLVSVFRVYHS